MATEQANATPKQSSSGMQKPVMELQDEFLKLMLAPKSIFTSETLDQTPKSTPHETFDAGVKLKFGMFIHFNLETFKGVQWVEGYHNPADFNPGGKILRPNQHLTRLLTLAFY